MFCVLFQHFNSLVAFVSILHYYNVGLGQVFDHDVVKNPVDSPKKSYTVKILRILL
jgi:hypothetical protein